MTEKRKPRIGPLDSVQAVRRELETDQLRGFVYCLKELRESLVSGELEQRVEALERIQR